MDAPVNDSATITNDVPIKPQRRRHSPAFKRQVVAEVLAGQESVSVIARRHDINANLIFKWKQGYLAGGVNTHQKSRLLPVQVTETALDQMPDPLSPGRIEIVLGANQWITVQGEVSELLSNLVFSHMNQAAT